MKNVDEKSTAIQNRHPNTQINYHPLTFLALYRHFNKKKIYRTKKHFEGYCFVW